jgi:chemotaxis protein CheX
MPFEPSDVGALIEMIWNVVLDCNVQAVETLNDRRDPTDALTGMVELTGAWEGVVALQCPADLMKQVASIMFEIEPDRVTLDQSEDALCELTNIVGGNLKALLPPPTHLGLPTVERDAVGPRTSSGAGLLTQLAFEANGFVFTVAIISSAAAADDARRRPQAAALTT